MLPHFQHVLICWEIKNFTTYLKETIGMEEKLQTFHS